MMKPEYLDALTNGEVVLKQRFETARGVYRIEIYRHEGSVYFFKYLNDKLVECFNANKKHFDRKWRKDK